jgi:tetratricopeptide (TPR) repeat protein
VTFSRRNPLSGHKRATLLLCILLSLLVATTFASSDARTALEKAVALVQQGELDGAERQARIALSDKTTSAAANSILGTIRFQQKRFPESVSFLEEAIRLEPRLIGARLNLAAVYEAENKPDQALTIYRKVLALDSSAKMARMAIVELEAQAGRYKESLEYAQPVLAELRQTPEGLFALTTDYLGTGDRAGAQDAVRDWVTIGSIQEDLAIRYGLLLAKQGELLGAIDVLEHAKQTAPRSYLVAFNLAGIYGLNNNLALALQNYDLALRIDPNSIDAMTQAALTAEKKGDLERSLSYWVRAKKLEPESPELLFGFGRICLKQDLLDDAETALTKAAGLKPQDPSYHYLLASVKVGKKQFDAAEQILDALVRKAPGDPQLQYALGSVLYLKGHLAEAANHLGESARLQPKQVASNYYLALIARDQGKDAEAIEILEKLLEEYPNHAPSRETLGELLMGAQRYPEAEANLQKAVTLNPSSVKANYQLGLLLSRMGKKAEADKQLELAKSLRTEDEKTSRLQLRLLEPEQ